MPSLERTLIKGPQIRTSDFIKSTNSSGLSWPHDNNKPILDLIDFTKTFFSKHTLLNVLTKYCVFTSERMLMVMRPYQIAATERIIERIKIANNYKLYGKIEGGGYIWHTTGSGKTLTSFKTAQLASRLDFIDKVLFVVDRKDLDQQGRDFLDGAIKDYNQMFGTNYDTSSERFQNYYKDLSLRMKNRQVDLLIMVNMFLTGFDATTLNTLYVDKNLRQHGLIQSYSRTNRILNSIKTFGNIVCFRNLQQETDDAIALFGDKDAASVVLLKDFNSYYNGYDTPNGKHCYGYSELVQQLTDEFPDGRPAMGEQEERRFIGLFGSLLKSINVLQAFDQFEGKELLTDGQMQDYQSHYLDLRDKWRKRTTWIRR